MTTAQQIITRALLDLQVIEGGSAPTYQESSDGLVYLNDLIQAWSNEGLMVNAITSDTHTADGSTSYTMGSSGDINTTRPIEIKSAYFTSNSIDYPVNFMTREQYEAISTKTNSSAYPYSIYVDYGYPLVTLYLYPVPSSGTLHLSSIKPISSLATLSTVLSLPNGYERALRLCLAEELMPMYGIENQRISIKAQQAKNDIMRVNSTNRPTIAKLGLPVSGRGYGNIYNGWNQ